MTFAKMRNENIIQYFSQSTHMSINTDNGKIYIYIWNTYICICTYNQCHTGKEGKHYKISVIGK